MDKEAAWLIENPTNWFGLPSSFEYI